MAKKRYFKIKRWYKEYKKVLWILVFLLLFPLVIGAVYALPLPRIIAIEPGDLIAYYGTAFGIVGSFILYRHEINKKEIERTKELQPFFTVEVSLIDKTSHLFKIDINNHTEQTLSYLSFYDEFISTTVKREYSFRVTFNKTIEEAKTINPQFNITMDPDIIDSDGYPSYIQLLCDDKDGNAWNCCYYKVKDCDRIYYYPRNFEVM